jgi:hypothetical protein
MRPDPLLGAGTTIDHKGAARAERHHTALEVPRVCCRQRQVVRRQRQGGSAWPRTSPTSRSARSPAPPGICPGQRPLVEIRSDRCGAVPGPHVS